MQHPRLRALIVSLPLGLLLALSACGQTITIADNPTPGAVSTATPATGGGATATPVVAPTNTPAPAPLSFIGTWDGNENVNGSPYSIRIVVTQCGSTVFAAYYQQVGGGLPSTPQDLAMGSASGATATMSDTTYNGTAPFAKNDWTLTRSSGALSFTHHKHNLVGGTDYTSNGSLSLNSGDVGTAPDFSGTWNGNEIVNGSSYLYRMVISECHQFIHADIYGQVSGAIPATPQNSAVGISIGGQVALQNEEYISGTAYAYSHWVLTLPSANDLHFVGSRHFASGGSTDQSSYGDLTH
ncbi:MAG: hypothetical protein H0X24_20570 [Ktedonobacterales bacterium]|nr:hypothetical protein [Ktedonobacterales bacterium]